jgi:hypothetical protein
VEWYEGGSTFVGNATIRRVPQIHSQNDVPIPQLLRQARGTYALAIRIHLSSHGYGDLARSGNYVVTGLEDGVSVETLMSEMDLDADEQEEILGLLLEGGYIEPDLSEQAEFAMALRNTERGIHAAEVVREAVSAVNDELLQMLTPEELIGFKAALAALGEIKKRTEDSLH